MDLLVRRGWRLYILMATDPDFGSPGGRPGSGKGTARLRLFLINPDRQPVRCCSTTNFGVDLVFVIKCNYYRNLHKRQHICLRNEIHTVPKCILFI